MAEDLVFNAISNLVSLYKDEVNLNDSVNQERVTLESNLSTIKAVLEDAEKKQLASKSNTLNIWMQKLKSAVYELDDVLDECSTESIRDEYEGDKSCAFLGFLHPQKVIFRHNIKGKMKSIIERLDFIIREKEQFNFITTERQLDANPSNIPPWRQTTYFITEDEVFGREKDNKIIVRHLLEGSSNEDALNVYPIVAMGGLGKTTLAKLVYHDESITKHFEMKKWICVSENFDLKTLLTSITKSRGSPCELDELVERLRSELQGKRYLIVLDDVWNDNPDKWMQLRSLLACGAKGSAVLVTTRLEKVAMIMKTPSAQPYELTALSEDDCWQVLRKLAFGYFKECQNLVSIGQEIARKCKGVPLVAKTVGGLLMFKADESFWSKIRDSELWTILPEEEGSIFSALKLSYLNLPPRYRRCFSFCTIFPKDYRIPKELLIHLWMANGLISEGPNTKFELEDIGEMVVDELYLRSLIQDIKRDDDSGRIISFKMHDLVHDLAQSVSSHESDAMEGASSTGLSPCTRYISIQCDGRKLHDIFKLSKMFEYSLRSLVFLSRSPVALALSESLKHARLRALDWSGLKIAKGLPSSIGVLKHLRYLNVSHSGITKLPDTIGSLWNLQTLNVSTCTYLETFPVSIGRLKKLRHLHNEFCFRLSSMPQSMVGLTSLRTLNLVVVGERTEKEFQLSGLEHLEYLQGKLQIEHLEGVRDVKDVERINLTKKQDLHHLKLQWSYREGHGHFDRRQLIQILEALRPPQSLRYLTISGYSGISFPHWMMNEIASFTHIQSLKLSYCECRRLPPLWRLPSLKDLEFFYFTSKLDEDPCGRESGKESGQELNKNCIIYPKLSTLDIVNSCPKLNSLTSAAIPSLRYFHFSDSEIEMLSILNSGYYNLQRFNSLKLLTISCCYSLEFFPDQIFQGMSSLENLYIFECYKLKCLPVSVKSLYSLADLSIDECPMLEDLSSFIVQLTSLQRLRLSKLLLKSLDADTSIDLPTLKHLELRDCSNLESLPNWTIHLASLEKLKLWSCPQLTSIPDNIQQLSKLEELFIAYCPELQQRCDEETGQDWHKIAHIPKLYI